MAVNNLNAPNTATTLSVFSRPGEDIRLINTNSDSIFTFGDFRIYQPDFTQRLSAETLSLNFDTFSTLDTLQIADFKPPQAYSVNLNELKLDPSNALSYSYFGSFYTETANAINNIINTFPYAILSYDKGTGTTIYDYITTFNNITGEKTASFKIPYSALTNQGSVLVNSSSTMGNISVANDYDKFAVQMSAQSQYFPTRVCKILAYNYSAGTNPYLEITVDDYIDYMSATTSSLPIYIRPTKERVAEYRESISSLENNLLFGFNLDVIDVTDDITEYEEYIIWPRTIDGFNPDIYGSTYDEFLDSTLKYASNLDEAKTNMLIRTVIPENYLELDSSRQIYATIAQTYAHEFDQMKKYIDGIAYAHSVTYNQIDNVPDKFMKKLSNLLGWKLSDKFNELDLFEYLAGDADGSGNSYSKYNLEIWRRILVNINWLYKKKGTRDALQFMFKLLGAPDCLLKLDEFTYNINQVISLSNEKINENGYVNYDASEYAFQEGGKGRGTGFAYINQWRPEFNPIRQVDNIKVHLADPNVFGSEDTLNTKELYAAMDPAAAIECDVFAFYQQSGSCWVWGSLYPPFSSLTVPFEYLVENCDDVWPENINNMTLAQYLDYVYANLVDPRTRKTIGLPRTSSYYPQLRNAYLSYYYWTEPQSNRLTFRKLQPFIDLIESTFYEYTMQLLPATTILEKGGTIIRNTVFNRQKFVYKFGLNAGSEFRTVIKEYNPKLNLLHLFPKVPKIHKSNINIVSISSTVGVPIITKTNIFDISSTINVNTFNAKVGTYSVTGTITSSSFMIIPQAPNILSP